MTAGASSFLSKISQTNTAIHTTRSDEFLFHYTKPDIDNLMVIKILPLKQSKQKGLDSNRTNLGC